MKASIMGRYDQNIANAKEMLAEAEEKYSNAVVSMANAGSVPRQFVLDNYQRNIDEAKQMIETFEEANRRG
ncbi:hypothetical protein [Arthrobacter oryzae]|uniref:hypothetical protein n=1 Tax=Arthrobacter oryzae TaxID=409290 RepID=UPI0028581E55|nr:hypothetical protein [Arthrobacter oryzae]MDR6507752.1 hypothetical protein [Arthrobacter oryzae]